MSKRRTGIALVVLAAAVLAALIIIKLVHREDGGKNEEGAVEMSVHTGKIQRATLHHLVTAYGFIMPEPAGLERPPAEAQVASPVAGIVARIECLEGQKVAKGAVLFQLDSRLADVAYEKAKKAMVFAEENFERQKKLLPEGGTSKKTYLEAEQQLNDARSGLAAAETDLAFLKIKAPLAGTVVKINTKPGEAVELNTVLAAIVDLDRLVAVVNIPSREVMLVKVGLPVQFETVSKLPGSVVYIGSKIDEKADTVQVRISLPAGADFLPGQFLSVRIVCDEHSGCLVVPEASIIADSVGSDTGKIVLVEDDKAIWKPVKIGLREGGLVEVSGDGLREGLVIVTEDAYAVPDAAKIHII